MYNEENYKHIESLINDISMEALVNPFGTATDVIRRKIHEVRRSIQDVTLNLNKTNYTPVDWEAKGKRFFDMKYGAVKSQDNSSKGITYIDVREINIPVPIGLIGSMSKFTDNLYKALLTFGDIDKDVIRPAEDLILKYLGRPETLLNVNNSDFSRIKLKTQGLEEIKEELNSVLDLKTKNQVSKLKAVYKSFDDIGASYKNVYSAIKFLNSKNPYERTSKAYTALLNRVDTLLMRIEQSPEKFPLNKLGAEKLATLMYSIAREIEFLTSVDFLLTQAMSSIMVTIETLDKMDSKSRM